MKNIVLIITCLLAWGTSFAQKTVKITGKITDEKAEALPYALVKLLSLPDSAMVKSVQANLDGKFSFEQVKTGDYILATSMVGYKNYKSSKLSIADDFVLPNIKLESLTKQLKQVTVEGKKPFIERRADKTVLNVENSIVSSGGTALEVLEKAPGVVVDKQNDQIRLNNKSGITVMIDGKPNILSGADLTTMLGNMSSDQIGTIEIITNPSAKYDAAGNAGIINIKLKKNKNFGTNGSIASTLGQGFVSGFPSDLYRTGLNLNLNHRVEKWNIFGNAAYARKSNFNQITVNRTSTANNLTSKFLQNFGRANKGDGYSGKIGADYYASAKTTIGVMVDANTINGRLDNFSQTYINEQQVGSSNNSLVNQQANSKSPANNITANFNIKHDFKKDGENISFDADYSGFSNKKNETFDADYLDRNNQLVNNTLLRNSTDASIDVFAVKTDYTLPISKSLGLEAGLKSSYVTTKNDFLSEKYITNNWVNDLGKSNNFIYKENINAAYVNLSKKWEKWEIQAGLRAENTNAKGNSITGQQKFDRNYLSLFPTVFISQNLNKDNNIRYSYGRRVDRPSYQQLSPFVFYMDPYAFDTGNPFLKPMFTDNFEISYSYKNAFSVSLNYSDTRDLIVQITEQNDVTRIVTVGRGNIGRSQNYSAGIYFPLTIAKWWNMQNNGSVYYNKVDDGNLSGAVYNVSNVAYNFNTSSSFRLPNNYSIEMNYWLNSPSINGQERATVFRHALNLGIQKSLMDKKLKVRANIDDVFLTNQWQGEIVYQNLDLQIKNKSSSRRASLNISYSFGNQNVKSARNRKTATDDIKGRAGSN